MEQYRAALAARAVNTVLMTRDAEAVGLSRFELAANSDQLGVVRVIRGGWSTTVDADPDTWHLVRAVALIRRQGGETGAHGHTALMVHGLPVVNADLERVHLYSRRQSATRRRAGYSVWSGRDELGRAMGHDLLTVAEPTLGVAPAVVWSGVTGQPSTALVAADAALRRGMVTAEELTACADALPRGVRGVAAVRAAVAQADARRESPGESLTALVCHQLGYVLVPQVEIGPYRVDFMVEGTNVIIEFDGAVKYDDRTALLREKRREDELRAMGFVLVRLMWADLSHPQAVAAKLQRALCAAA